MQGAAFGGAEDRIYTDHCLTVASSTRPGLDRTLAMLRECGSLMHARSFNSLRNICSTIEQRYLRVRPHNPAIDELRRMYPSKSAPSESSVLSVLLSEILRAPYQMNFLVARPRTITTAKVGSIGGTGTSATPNWILSNAPGANSSSNSRT